MPLLKSDRMESTKGTYATEWASWEKQLREILFRNADYLNSIQVTFELAVTKVLEQLKIIAKGDYTTLSPSTEKRKFGTIVFAAINLPTTEVRNLLADLEEKYPKIGEFLKDKNTEDSLRRAHVTLAHKRDHGVPAVANHGPFINQNVPVDISALYFSEKLAAFEAHPGSGDGEKIKSKNEWPHITLWTAEGMTAKEANTLPQLYVEGNATRIELTPPFTITGTIEFY